MSETKLQTMGQNLSTESRVRGALYGVFIGDALAMPVHWYYSRSKLLRDYGYVTDYLPPKNPHPDSILWRSVYNPPNRKGDILHDQARYWGQQGVHYHQFLKAGENTLNLQICRLLIDSLNHQNGYDPNDFISRYLQFMQNPAAHRDTYVEEYHRNWFTNYANGIARENCGTPEKHISGLIGMVPILLAYANDPVVGETHARAHLALSHRGPRMTAAADVLIGALLPILQGEPLARVLAQMIDSQRYALLQHPLRQWQSRPDDWVVGSRLSSACYVEDAIPATIYLALKHHADLMAGLISNTNLGGENAARGAVLGALLGAANGFEAIPERWIKGLIRPPHPLKMAG